MEIPKDLVIPILEGKVTTIFKLFSGRYELCGERNLTISRRTYCTADILSTRKCTIDKITDEDLKRGNFKDLYEFEKWWFAKGYHKNSVILVINFEILQYKPRARWYMKIHGKRLPRKRGD